jgi:hypothetical protein
LALSAIVELPEAAPVAEVVPVVLAVVSVVVVSAVPVVLAVVSVVVAVVLAVVGPHVTPEPLSIEAVVVVASCAITGVASISAPAATVKRSLFIIPILQLGMVD